MKRLVSLFLLVMLLLSLAGCGEVLEETTAAATEAVAVQETALSLELPEKNYEIKPYEPLPPVDPACGWNDRLLSDEELTALLLEEPNILRNTISTVADAAAYLDLRFPYLWMDACSQTPEETTTFHYSSPQSHLMGEYTDANGEPVLGRFDICNILMWLVEDDLPVGILYAAWSDGPNPAANYLRTTEGYIIFDPVLGMQGNEGSIFNGINVLPEAEVATLEDYIPQASKYCPIWKLYAWEEAQNVDFERDVPGGFFEVTKPALEALYENPDNLNGNIQSQAVPLAGPEDIHSFQLSKMLGGLTLTAEEAKALVDAEPETVKEQVKTAADLLLYMLAAQITDCGGDIWYGTDPNTTWHYNLNAFQVMEQKKGNCGASANLANYLLEGDYEEVGFILHAYYPGNGGGHVYSYFLYEGKYYIVDYSWYIFANYNIHNDFQVMGLDSLEEYGQRFHELYGGVCMVLAHQSSGQHMPNIFNDSDQKYTVPDDGAFTILYQSNDPTAYTVNTASVPAGVPNWKEFGND